MTPPQRQREDTLLLLVEKGEAIQIQVFPVQIAGLGQAVAQLLHPGAHIRLPGAQPGIVGGEDHGHVPQLVAHGSLHVSHMAIQCLRGNPIGVKFVGQHSQLMQKRRPLRGPSEHLQIAVQLLQAAAHGQQLAAVVQRHVRQSSGLSQHTGGKALKAEHLRIAAGRGAAGAAQIQFRLVGGVLRHQQQLRAVLPLPGHGLQHTGGFAASRAADPDGQHGGCPPLLIARFSHIIAHFFRLGKGQKRKAPPVGRCFSHTGLYCHRLHSRSV